VCARARGGPRAARPFAPRTHTRACRERRTPPRVVACALAAQLTRASAAVRPCAHSRARSPQAPQSAQQQARESACYDIQCPHAPHVRRVYSLHTHTHAHVHMSALERTNAHDDRRSQVPLLSSRPLCPSWCITHTHVHACRGSHTPPPLVARAYAALLTLDRLSCVCARTRAVVRVPHRELSLHGNKLSNLPVTIFTPLLSLTYVERRGKRGGGKGEGQKDERACKHIRTLAHALAYACMHLALSASSAFPFSSLASLPSSWCVFLSYAGTGMGLFARPYVYMHACA